MCSLDINTLRSRQNGRHFADDMFKCIFVNENVGISIKISLKFVHKGPINNIQALAQKWLGAEQATSHYLNQWWLFYWRIYASLGLNELMLVEWHEIVNDANSMSLRRSSHNNSISTSCYIHGVQSKQNEHFADLTHHWRPETFPMIDIPNTQHHPKTCYSDTNMMHDLIAQTQHKVVSISLQKK